MAEPGATDHAVPADGDTAGAKVVADAAGEGKAAVEDAGGGDVGDDPHPATITTTASAATRRVTPMSHPSQEPTSGRRSGLAGR
jgi:hypothetical protein